jgi:hypothetical protein
MKNMKCIRVVLYAAILITAQSRTSLAAPTMIRIGYSDCATCHLSPQGGGLLTTYGKGVDEAQSLRRREVHPVETEARRLLYDVRFVAASHLVDAAAQPNTSSSTFRAMVRSSVKVSERHRMSYSFGLESPSLTPTARTTPVGNAANFVISKAVWEYRPAEGLDITVGRDEMPSGIGLPDPLAFIRKANDPGNTGYPTQAKVFWQTSRVQLQPYIFGPGGDEPGDLQQYGAGVIGGVDVWKQRAVVGMSGRTANSSGFNRRSVGAFARLGFGKWGILAEHDLTSRTEREGIEPTSRYLAGHTQVFFAPYEWLVTSLGTEHLVIEGPGARHLYRMAPGVQTRLSDNLTLIFTMRDAFTGVDAGRSRTFSVQVAVKTVE